MNDKEKTLQEFKDILIRVSEDSSVSNAVRKVIKNSLLKGVTIIPEEYISDSGRVANTYVYTNTIREDIDDVPFIVITPNAYCPSESFIFLESRPISEEHNDLLVLIHELAHAAFDLFLSLNTEKLVEIFYPHGLVYRSSYLDGSISLSQELETYLSERFALEIEFLALRDMYNKYFSTWWSGGVFEQGVLEMPQDIVSRVLANKVCQAYDITNPAIITFNDIPLTELLP